MRLFGMSFLFLLFHGMAMCGITDRSVQEMTRDTLLDKIKGGWAGQMIGVSIGAPTEFTASDAPYSEPLIWDIPSSVTNSINQDDLYVEMTFAKVMDTEGLDAPAESYAKAFGDSQYALWHANYFARKNIRAGIMPPMSGHPDYNSHADCIDFQIEADFIGLMCPGLPVTSNKFCDRIGHIMNYGDGVYGGMFVCAMYAAAFVESDPASIVQAGLASIPEQSDYAMAIREMIRLHAKYPDQWEAAWQEFYQNYVNTETCPELVLHPMDIDAKVNGAFIVMGLLYGDGDFKKTLSLAIAGGHDSDCNGASAAGILGTVLGYDALPKDWTAQIEVMRDQKFAFTDYSFEDVCASTLRRAEKNIVQAGGHVNGDVIEIKSQKPKSAPLESWHHGRPSYFTRFDMPSLKWVGEWACDGKHRASHHKGDKAVLVFEGTGFIIHLYGGQMCGMADIYLDGEKIGTYDGYRPYADPEIQAYYKTIGTKVQRHRLEIVNTGQSNPEATNTALGVIGVQVFGENF